MKKFTVVIISIILLILLLNFANAEQTRKGFDIRVEEIKKGTEEVVFSEIEFSWNPNPADVRKVVVKGDNLYSNSQTGDVKKIALLDLAESVINGYGLTKDKYTAKGIKDLYADLKSQTLYDAVVYFVGDPDFDHSLMKEIEAKENNLPKIPLQIRPVVSYKIETVIAQGKGAQKQTKLMLKTHDGLKTVVDNILGEVVVGKTVVGGRETPDTPLLLVSSFHLYPRKTVVGGRETPETKQKRIATINSYLESQNGNMYSINLSMLPATELSLIKFQGLVGDGFIETRISGKSSFSLKKDLTDSIPIITIHSPELDTLNVRRNAKESTELTKPNFGVKNVAIKISKKDAATQEIEFAELTVKKVGGAEEGTIDIKFNYKNNVYSFNNLKDESYVYFNPAKRKFGTIGGALKLGECEFSSGAEITLKEKSCEPELLLVYAGETYTYHPAILSVTAPKGGKPVAFFTDKKMYDKYKGPAVLLTKDPLSDKEGAYRVESKGIVQYQHLSTIVKTQTETTETTFNIHEPLNTLWVRNGKAIVEKEGVRIRITSTQTEQGCQLKVEQDRETITPPVRTTTEALLIPGSTKGKCSPGETPTEFCALGMDSTFFCKGSAEGIFNALTQTMIDAKGRQLPIGMPLSNRVNGMIAAIDVLLMLKEGLAEEYGVAVPKGEETLWETVKSFGSYSVWFLQDITEAAINSKRWCEGSLSNAACGVQDTNRIRFGPYLYSTVWGLRNLKGMLENGIPPDQALEYYKQGEGPDPADKTGEKMIKLPGSTKLTYDFLSLIGADGKIDTKAALELAKQFKNEGESSASWFKFDFVKNDYYIQYYFLMDTVLHMAKLYPVSLSTPKGAVRRSVDYFERGEPTLSYNLHTKNILGPTVQGGFYKSYSIYNSEQLAKIIDGLIINKLYYERESFLPGGRNWMPNEWAESSKKLLADTTAIENAELELQRLNSAGIVTGAKMDPILLRDSTLLELNKAEGLKNLIEIREEYFTLQKIETVYPLLQEVGKEYETAYSQFYRESITDFFAQWVDPFLVADAAVTFAKVTVRGFKAIKFIRAMHTEESLSAVMYGGRSGILTDLETAFGIIAKGRVPELGSLRLISGCAVAPNLCFLENLAEVKKVISRELGDDAAEEFSESMGKASEQIDILLKEIKISPGAKVEPIEKGLIVPPEALLVPKKPLVLEVRALLKNAREGTLPGLIKIGDKNGITFKVGRQGEETTMYFVRESEMQSYAQLFEKTELGYEGVTKNKEMIIVVLEELAEEGGNLGTKILEIIEPKLWKNPLQVENIHPENVGLWNKLRYAAAHELQHANDQANSLKLTKEVSEGRAFTGSFTNVPIGDVKTNFRYLVKGAYTQEHQEGQINVLAEFVTKYGKEGKTRSGFHQDIGKFTFDNFLFFTKGNYGDYTRLRKDALTIAESLSPEEIQTFGKNLLSYFDNVERLGSPL